VGHGDEGFDGLPGYDEWKTRGPEEAPTGYPLDERVGPDAKEGETVTAEEAVREMRDAHVMGNDLRRRDLLNWAGAIEAELKAPRFSASEREALQYAIDHLVEGRAVHWLRKILEAP
jgi:hypothetical protein